MPKYSIVVPVYNSENSLELLYERISKVFNEYYNGDFELILVDDSSKDHAADVMRKLHQQDHRVKNIFLAKNFGQHRALLCGFQFASGEFVITLDDDLQHPPEEIPSLLNYFDEHPEIDVVCGSYLSKKHGPIRNLGTMATNAFTSHIFSKPKDLHLTSFRAMRHYVVAALCQFTDARPRIGHLILRTTNRIANVTVQHDKRRFGKSGYSFKRLVKDFIDNILYNSDLPLSVLGWLGVFNLALSVILVLYYLIRYFVTGYSTEGFATLVILLLAFGGLILFGLGIIGHYLSQIVSEAKKMPTYIIRDKEFD